MKSLIFTKYGTVDDLSMGERDKPVPAAEEVLVRIHASSINSWDLELLTAKPFANRMMFGLFRPKVKTLGADIAGRIEAVGSEVTHFQVGDAVYGDLCEHGWGGFAEYVAVHQNALTPKPEGLSFSQAAALPQAGLLAWQGLCDKGHLAQGKKVLINGASGGSGTLAIQIAKAHGAEVTAVCSRSKMDLVSELGADHVINYEEEDFTRNNKHYDLILDVKSFHSPFDCRRVLAAGGRYVIVGGASGTLMQNFVFDPLLSRLGDRQLGVLLHKPNKGLDELGRFVEQAGLRPVIDSSFTLDDAVEAMRYYADGRARGKVVITMVNE